MTVTYLLDTNTISYIACGKSNAARERLMSLSEDEVVCISSITEAEIRYGLDKRPEAKQLRAAMEGFLQKLRILSWGSAEAKAYGALRAKLEAGGITLSELDMQIAAHALALGAVLVSNDHVFGYVTNLKATVNWATDI